MSQKDQIKLFDVHTCCDPKARVHRGRGTSVRQKEEVFSLVCPE